MKNKLLTLLSALLCFVMVLSFAGCAEKTAENSSTNKPPVSSETPSEPEEPSSEPGVDEEIVGGDDEELPELDDNFGTNTEDEVVFDEVTIHNTKDNITTTKFRGLNGIYNLFGGLSDVQNRGYTDEQVKLEYDRVQKTGVSSVRSFYGSSLVYNWNTKTLDFENPNMLAFYESCKEMEKRGIEVGITPQWDFAALVSGDVTEQSIVNLLQMPGVGVKGDFDKTCENFAKFVEDTVLAFKRHGVNNVKDFYCFTEVQNAYKRLGIGQDAPTLLEKRHYDEIIPLYDKAIKAVDSGLKASGFRNQYRIVGPCDNWYNAEGDEPYSVMTRYTIEKLSDYVDVIGSHRDYCRGNEFVEDNFFDYTGVEMGEQIQEVNAAGKEFWIDEYDVKMSAEFDITEARRRVTLPYKGTAFGAMTASLMELGVNNVNIWSLSAQLYNDMTTNNGEFQNGVQTGIGYWPSLFESYKPHPAWYSFSMLATYIGKGTTYKCTHGYGVYAGYIEREDGNLTVMVCNYNIQDTPVKFSFEESLGGKTLYKHIYNPNTIQPTTKANLIGVTGRASGVENTFYDTLPAGAVAVYTTVKD